MEQIELTQLLTQLISTWENEVIEFKRGGEGFSTDNIGKYFSALSNEANLRHLQRGWLVFGVDNKTHAVIGSDYRMEPARLNSLKMQMFESTDPSISLNDIHVLSHPNGRVVFFEIPAAPQGIPIAWKGHWYARSGESLVALNLDKLESIRREGQQDDWSAQLVPEARISDLDEEALQIARIGFARKHANRFSEEDIAGWSVETFLDRARVTRNGKLTRTAILLLGKTESAHFLNPNPAQMTWKLVGEERAYEHFGPPFLLNSTGLYNRIRNIQVRILPLNSLLATEVAKYDRRIVLEGLHNCIAHQDFTLNRRIIVTEYIDRITLYNGGNFFDGEPMDYVHGNKTPSRYRNMLLATAMAELNMIDTMGYGIRDMFVGQAKRGFPLQDYDREPDAVTVTIYGHIIDEAYSTILLQKTTLPMDDIVLLDRIQKKMEVNASGLSRLRKAGLIEGKRPNIRIASAVSGVTSALRRQPKTGAQVQGAQVQGDTLFISILRSLKEGPMRKALIASTHKVKINTGSFNRAFAQLLTLGFIEPTEGKSRSKKQAYRITSHGLDHLANKTNR